MRRMRSLFGLRPAPGNTDQAKADRIASLVDSDFYLRMNPDVRQAGLDPAVHYANYGWREGRDPSPGFSTLKYLADHPQLSGGSINPLEHFAMSSDNKTKTQNLQEVMDIVGQEFDVEYYSRKYADVLGADDDPLEYYCTHGWQKGHNPCRGFSTSHYLTVNGDVKSSGINPFWHYLVAGRDEGRTPKPISNWQIKVATNLRTIGDRRRDWLRRGPCPKLVSAAKLSEKLASLSIRQDLIIALSHDDYRVIPGGVQLCMGLEQTDANRRGIDYLNLHPWQTLPVLADIDTDPVLCLTLNGELLGHARMSAIITAAAGFKPEATTLVCHHLAGHSPEGVAALADSIKLRTVDFWLHDYFALCTCFTLRRNDLEFCGAPDQGSNACTLCMYGPERRLQSDRFEALFAHLDVHLISPSDVALKLWKSRCNLRVTSSEVAPHMILTPHARTDPSDTDFPDKFRIAFIGNPSSHKGWPVFEELRERLALDDRFEFWMFGVNDPGDPDLTHVETHASAENPGATVRGLKDNQIDIVLHWADWQETFSLSTFEAFAAGACVVTNEGSGNVAAAVLDQNCGLVLRDADELFEIAKGDALVHLAEQSRATRISTEMTFEYSAFSLSRLPELARAV